MGRADRVPERRSVDHCGELELVATGHEDACDVVEAAHQVGVVRVFPRLRTGCKDVCGSERAERRVVHLDHLGSERGRSGYDGDLGAPASGTVDERPEHGSLPELVLGTADREKRTGCNGFMLS